MHGESDMYPWVGCTPSETGLAVRRHVLLRSLTSITVAILLLSLGGCGGDGTTGAPPPASQPEAGSSDPASDPEDPIDPGILADVQVYLVSSDSVTLRMTFPTNPDFGGVLVLRRDDGVFPESPSDPSATLVAQFSPRLVDEF